MFTVMKTFIEKLYKKKLHFKFYNTILLFIIDTEIVNQLLYVKQLLEEYQNYEIKIRKIALF